MPAFVIGFVAMAVVRTIGDATLESTGAAFGVWTRGGVASADDAAGRLLGVAHPAGHRDGGGGPQHQLQGVQGGGSKAVRGGIRRRGRRRRRRHDDGDHSWSLRSLVAPRGLTSFVGLASLVGLAASAFALRRSGGQVAACGTRRCAPRESHVRVTIMDKEVAAKVMKALLEAGSTLAETIEDVRGAAPERMQVGCSHGTEISRSNLPTNEVSPRSERRERLLRGPKGRVPRAPNCVSASPYLREKATSRTSALSIERVDLFAGDAEAVHDDREHQRLVGQRHRIAR